MAKLPTEAEAPRPTGPTVGAPTRRVDATAPARMAIPQAIGPAKGAPAPTGQVRGPWWYCIHPLRWRVLEGTVVPDPKVLHGTPGANGVDRSRDGSPVMTHAFHAQADQGWMVLDHQIAGPGTSYLQQIESNGSWISLWTKAYPGSPNTSHDAKSEAKWWAELVAAGKIDACPLHVLTNMRTQNERVLNRYVDLNRAKDGARMKRIRAVLEAIDNEIAKFQEAA